MEMEKMIELIDAVSKSDLTGFKYEEEGDDGCGCYFKDSSGRY